MKRNIILLGNKTYVVSLPLKWVKENNLNKGDELNLEIKDKNIVISLDKAKNKSECKRINIKELNPSLIWKIITSLYISGIDCIEIEMVPEQIDLIKEITSNLIGFVIFSYKEDFAVIKSLAEPRENLSNIISKFLLGLKDNIKQGIDYWKKEDYSSLLELSHKDHELNKFIYYALRMIITSAGLPNKEKFKMFNLITSYEMCCDHIINLFSYAGKNKIKLTYELNKEINNLFNCFSLLIKNYYKFDIDRYNKICDIAKSRKDYLDKGCKDIVLSKISMIYKYLLEIADLQLPFEL